MVECLHVFRISITPIIVRLAPYLGGLGSRGDVAQCGIRRQERPFFRVILSEDVSLSYLYHISIMPGKHKDKKLSLCCLTFHNRHDILAMGPPSGPREAPADHPDP
jgi:hypothetical protein